MSHDYTDLDLDHKKELLVNLQALMVVAETLQALTALERTDIIREVFEKAYDEISSLPDKDIDNLITEVEKNRRPFTAPGRAVIL